jgi:hypothetical protein
MDLPAVGIGTTYVCKFKKFKSWIVSINSSIWFRNWGWLEFMILALESGSYNTSNSQSK